MITITEKTTVVNDKKYTFHWPSSDAGGWEGPLHDWVKNNKVWTSYCKKFNTVVQAGGACGMYPKFYSEIFETVYTFEPSHIPFYFLNVNCPQKNVIKLNAAVGASNGLVGIWDNNKTNMGTHFIDRKEWLPKTAENFIDPEPIVPTLTIDQLALNSCDLIHLDCEGSEFYAIQGAKQTIEKFKPVVVLERGRGGTELEGYTRVFGTDESYEDSVFVPNNA